MPFITCNPGPPTSTAFVPTSVSGCRMWLDGADASTITLSGPNVTNVREKANNINMANTGTVTQTTIGTQSALSFGGSGYLSGNVSSFLIGTVVIVFKATAANSGYNPFFAWYDSAGTKDPAFGYVPGGNTVAPYTTFIGPGTPTTTVSIGTSYVASYSWTGTTTAVGFNGATPTSGTQGAYSDSQTLLWIGYDNGGYLIATIGEILLYNSVLGQTDRQNVEGYLAQKWGLTASLPPGHPGLTTNYAGSQPRVFRLGPLPGTRTPFLVTPNEPVPAIVYTLTVVPDARYSFLTAPSGTITNTGSSGSIGAATIVSATYTATSPSYITFTRGTGYILAPSIAGIQTLILIVKVRDATSPAYILDARTGLGGGYLYSSGGTDHIGPDWTSATYYRDAVNTTFSGNFILALQDSTWHHVCIQRASFTSAITFLARYSQNETLGCDCGEIMIFTGALTAQQVKDNYNFFSGRFGWTPV